MMRNRYDVLIVGGGLTACTIAAGVRREVQKRYPNLILAGRLGRYAYIDMHAAVSLALKISEKL